MMGAPQKTVVSLCRSSHLKLWKGQLKMGRPGKIAERASELNLSEADYLAQLLKEYPTAKDIAIHLEVSHAAVTTAMDRNGFVHKSEWVREGDESTCQEPA